ncbi:hypothetical protein PD653_2561 [Nocardioides sp. PD653]|nr:hypothetical protein PD653B2_1666 [Nocardioides sp. PD653-B2]GAW55142.1 hypothetical protein PD653_2561 [Nocardioides sp. PD653]
MLVVFLGAGLRLGLVLRDRVLEPLRPVLREVLAALDEDVLLLRDPGGEDVRVAIVPTLRRRHSSHTHHRSACRGRVSGPEAGGRASGATEERRRDPRVETRRADGVPAPPAVASWLTGVSTRPFGCLRLR